MKLKYFLAVIALIACVFLGVRTLTQLGSHADTDGSSAGQMKESVGPGIGTQVEFASTDCVTAISAIIVSQLNAFKSNNYQLASTFIDSGVIHRLGSPDHFRRVISTRYPEIADYQSVFFGPMIITYDKSTVEGVVDVTGVDGITRKAIYILVNDQGVYRIAGLIGGDAHTRRALIHFNLDTGYVGHIIKSDNSL